MTNGEISGKIPEKLDLNEWIDLALHSEDEVGRQIALEELSATGIPPYMLARIREISARDTSSVCRQLAAWLDSLDRAKAELKAQMKGLEITPENIRSLLVPSEPARAVVISQMLRRAPSEDMLQRWRDLLGAEKNAKMIEIGLTLLAKFGKPSDADLAPMLLAEHDSDIVCAALTLLQQQDAGLFKKHVRTGLASKSFKIQLHAVHLLRMVDCDEAVKYIQAFLFHKNALIRQKALREMMLVDYSLVENLCLQYLGREIQPLLLVKAGFVAAFNPSTDSPLKIYDILNMASGNKKHILNLVLKQSLEAIQASGILKQPIESYMNELRQKILFRKSEQVIRCALRDLTNKEPAFRSAAVDRLLPYAEYPSIKATLLKHLEIEKDPDIRVSIESAVGEEKAKIPATSTDKIDPAAFHALPLKEQRQQIASIRSDDAYLKNRQAIIEIFAEFLKKSVVLDILKLINRFGSRLDSAAVAAKLEDKDPSVAAMALKTLGKIDIDAILPHLNRFLAHDDPRIKSAALELFMLADKEGAIQYLSSMLRSASIATRRLGLSLLPQLDYPSAEPMLWHRLEHEVNGELKVQVGYMVAANPTKDGLKKLYAFSHDKNGEVKRGCEEIWQLALISAESSLHKTSEEIEASCWENFKIEQEVLSEEKAAYAYKSVIGESGSDDLLPEDDVDPVEKFFLHLFEFKWHYIIGAVALTPFIWNIFSVAPVITHPKKHRTEAGAQTSFLKTESVSNKKTQVGTEDWQGTLKTGAREILSGRGYSQILATSRTEVERVYSDYNKDFRQHMLDLTNNPDETEEVRMLAAANLNASFVQANRAWIEGNFSEAEMYFEQAVNDPQMNSFGRCVALQKLGELAETKKDKLSWLKWQDRLMKELKTMPGYEDIQGFENFAATFGKMIEISQSLSSGGSAEAIVEGLKSQGESDSSARESVDVLKNMDAKFQSFFGNSY